MIFLADIPKVLQWRLLLQAYAKPPLLWIEAAAIVWEESSGDPLATNPSDPSWGLMNITEPIARAYGGIMTAPARSLNPLDRIKKPNYGYDTTHPVYDPEKNIATGCAFLTDLKTKWSVRYPNYHFVAAYNEGEGNLNRGLEDAAYVGGFIERFNALNEYLAAQLT